MLKIADDEFFEKFLALSEVDQRRFVFLENHPTLERFWDVDGFDPLLRDNLKGVISPRGYLTPFNYAPFAQKAEELGYSVYFIDDPSPIFDWVDSLKEPPIPGVNSSFPNTVKGLLPFQVPAYNFCKGVPGSVLNAATGTGKTVIASAMMAWHLDRGRKSLWVVKAHNKINTARMIRALTGYEGIIVDGTKAERLTQWGQISDAKIGICNYEVFRSDLPSIIDLIADQEYFFVWDEMPTKLRNRQTVLYRKVCEALFKSKQNDIYYPSKRTRGEFHHIMLSATPIEHSPEDYFNCVRIIQPAIYGSVKNFNNLFVAGRDLWGSPNRWRNLDLMGAMASPITFSIDKDSPDIAAQFPKTVYEDVVLDLPIVQLGLYRSVMKEYSKIFSGGTILDPDEALSIIQVLQYICDNPSVVPDSAQEWIDSNGVEGSEVAWKMTQVLGAEVFRNAENVKMEVLMEVLKLIPGKKVVFSPFNKTLMPLFHSEARKASIPHVLFHGELSMTEKQAVQDEFTQNPDCEVFFSSDAGSDSINLECANSVIHYSLPWNWSTLVQRSSRIHRITSTFDHITVYTLLCANTVEDRKMDILIRKYRYHKSVLQGEIAEQSDALRSGADLRYILLGDD